MERLFVLLVEDEPSDAELIEEYLSENTAINFVVSNAQTIKETLHLLENHEYDIILLDLGLPDSSGLDSLKEIYEQYSHTPILVITGLDNEMTGRESITIGAQGYIPKSRMDSYLLVNTMLHSIERHHYIQKIKKNEHELQLKNQLLTEANAAKNRLFSIISHDLKSPFNSILGLLNLIYFNFDEISDEKKRVFVKACIDTATNTHELVENLLSWALAQSGKIQFKPSRIDLLTLIEKTFVPLQQAAVDKEIQVDINVPDNLSLFVDEDAINTVLRNLISNAIKFTPRGGHIGIELVNTDNGMATICVNDNGMGIEPENISKLFDVGEGFTTPGTENEKGTGLGMILCKEFVTKNGGKIWIESVPDKGTSIFFTLPIA